MNWLLICIWFVIPKIPLVERISCSRNGFVECCAHTFYLCLCAKNVIERASERCQWTFDKYAFADHFFCCTLRVPFFISFVVYFNILASQHTAFFYEWIALNCSNSCETIRRNFIFYVIVCVICRNYLPNLFTHDHNSRCSHDSVFRIESGSNLLATVQRVCEFLMVILCEYSIRCDVIRSRWKSANWPLVIQCLQNQNYVIKSTIYRLKMFASVATVRRKTNHTLGADLIDRWYRRPPLSRYIFAYIFSTPRDADSPEIAVKITWISLLALCLSLWASGTRESLSLSRPTLLALI